MSVVWLQGEKLGQQPKLIIPVNLATLNDFCLKATGFMNTCFKLKKWQFIMHTELTEAVLGTIRSSIILGHDMMEGC